MLMSTHSSSTTNWEWAVIQSRCLNGSTVPMWPRSASLLSIHDICKSLAWRTEDLKAVKIGGRALTWDNTVGANMSCVHTQDRSKFQLVSRSQTLARRVWLHETRKFFFFALSSCQESKPWALCSWLEVSMFWLHQMVHHSSESKCKIA